MRLLIGEGEEVAPSGGGAHAGGSASLQPPPPRLSFRKLTALMAALLPNHDASTFSRVGLPPAEGAEAAWDGSDGDVGDTREVGAAAVLGRHRNASSLAAQPVHIGLPAFQMLRSKPSPPSWLQFYNRAFLPLFVDYTAAELFE